MNINSHILDMLSQRLGYHVTLVKLLYGSTTSYEKKKKISKKKFMQILKNESILCKNKEVRSIIVRIIYLFISNVLIFRHYYYAKSMFSIHPLRLIFFFRFSTQQRPVKIPPNSHIRLGYVCAIHPRTTTVVFRNLRTSSKSLLSYNPRGTSTGAIFMSDQACPETTYHCTTTTAIYLSYTVE